MSEVTQEVIEKALKNGVLLKDNTGLWKKFVGAVVLMYYAQFQKYAFICTPINPKDAIVIFFDEYKIKWDIIK